MKNKNTTLSLVTMMAVAMLVGCGSNTTQDAANTLGETSLESAAETVTENTNDNTDAYETEIEDDTTEDTVVDTVKVAGWYLSTKVSVYDSANDKTYKGTNPAIIGKLDESSNAYDKNDVPVYDSVMERKAAVVFVQTDWDEKTGEYHSNYHHTQGEDESWTMTVFSSVPNAEVTLTWDGLYALTYKNNASGYNETKEENHPALENLHLSDAQTGEEIVIRQEGKRNSYTFNMGKDEVSRTFVWTLGENDSDETAAAVKSYISSKQQIVQSNRSRSVRTVEKQGHGDFGLPPM